MSKTKDKRFLVEYEIESHGILDPSLTSVTFQDPRQKTSIEIRDKHVTLGLEVSILAAYVFLEADSLPDAEEKGLGVLHDFVDMLTFCSSMHFRVSKKIRVADWTPNVGKRECIIINNFPGDDRPYPVLDNELLHTIETFLSCDISGRVRRALSWFSNGVSAKYRDEKFQFFWFVIEILSQEVKPTEKVTDKCPVCQNPLYCATCEKHPSHRPYPKQAIEHLFSLITLEKQGGTFTRLNEIRNKLMHGDTEDEIERNLAIDLSEQVDTLGQIAWKSILHILKQPLSENGKELQLRVIMSSTFCEQEMQARISGFFKCKDESNPKIEELPNINVTRTRVTE